MSTQASQPVNDPGGEPAERDPQSTPPKGRDPIPQSTPETPPLKDPPRERSNDEPGAPLPMIQEPPAPDANPIDPRVFESR